MRAILIFLVLFQHVHASEMCEKYVEEINMTKSQITIRREVVRKCSGYRDIARHSKHLSGQFTIAASIGGFLSSGVTYWAVNDDKEKNYEWWVNGVQSIATQMLFTIFNAKYLYGTLRASTFYGQTAFNYGVVSAQEVVSSLFYHYLLQKNNEDASTMSETQFREKVGNLLTTVESKKEFEKIMSQEFGKSQSELGVMNKLFRSIDENVRLSTVGNTEEHLLDLGYEAADRGGFNMIYNLVAVPLTSYVSYRMLRHICSSTNSSHAVAQATAFYLVYRLLMDTTYYSLRRPIADQ